MTEFTSLLQQGATNAWLFIPSAILLGALHGLEPGHSKTMMAAFIVAIRGTIPQAIMLGLAATVSHTAVVWVMALIGMHLGSQWNAEKTEPYLQMASAVMIIGVALWMVWRTWSQQKNHLHSHLHEHGHGHPHDEAAKRIDTGHEVLLVEVFEDGVPPRFRIHPEKEGPHDWEPQSIVVETERPDGNRQVFLFVHKESYWESVDAIPEPHEFIARLSIGHENHSHSYEIKFAEADHGHAGHGVEAIGNADAGYQDPHELAHASDIRHRFENRPITNGQLLVFGLTGGLVPCPTAITVLMLCLQLKKFTLGASLVVCFSLGLALTMVLSGVLAAISVHHAAKRWAGFGEFTRKAPYFSGGIILLVGFYIGYQGFHSLVW